MPGGRPSKYEPGFCVQAQKLCELGATDREVAEFFEVAESTLNLWKHQHAEFSESLKLGKQASDERVEKSLYRRAVGYSYDAVKIFPPKVGQDADGNVASSDALMVPYVEHVPPDTTACIFWLKNRRTKDWRDRHELTGADGAPFVVNIIDPTIRDGASALPAPAQPQED